MKNQNFIESFAFHVAGGKGGLGNKKFGAVGGKGGDVVLAADKNITLNNTMYHVRQTKIRGEPGDNATPSNLVASRGKDYKLTVPVHSVVYDDWNNKLGEFTMDRETIKVSAGGCGGSAVNDYIGDKGMIRRIRLVMKVLADVGLVGFPNAGKSTLLTSLSRAKPIIAPYAFTTMMPQVGHIYFDDYRKISITDLPGLIEGAWNNEGLGHEFLRHVERTKLLLYVVDINGFQLDDKHPHRSAFECIMLLNKELEIYDSSLLYKPSILAINKVDQKNSKKNFEKIVDQMKNRREIYQSCPEYQRPKILANFNNIVPVSAKFRYNVDNIQNVIRHNIDQMYKSQEQCNIKTAKNKLKKLLKLEKTPIHSY